MQSSSFPPVAVQLLFDDKGVDGDELPHGEGATEAIAGASY